MSHFHTLHPSFIKFVVPDSILNDFMLSGCKSKKEDLSQIGVHEDFGDQDGKGFYIHLFFSHFFPR